MNEMFSPPEVSSPDFAELTTGVVSAFVSNNRVAVADLPALIATTHAALSGLARAGTPSSSAAEKPTTAQIKRSITPDALISFEDGKSYKTLRRHLTLRGLTPEAYRAKWGLGSSYPMTAQSYSEARSALAKSLGLGQLRRKFAAPEPVPAAEPPKKRGRRKAADVDAAG